MNSYNGINSVDNIGQTYSGSGILYEKYTIGARTDVAVYKNVNGERVYNFNFIMDTPYNYTPVNILSSGVYTFGVYTYGTTMGTFTCGYQS